MQRRRFLAALAAGTASAAAGCLAPSADGGDRGATGGVEGSRDGAAPRFPSVLPVPRADLVRGANRDAIPAIVDPAFGPDWSDVELVARTEFGRRTIRPRLASFDRVVGVVRDGEARAYPLRVLARHEVVNDELGGPLLVTYCPLCGSGMVARRTVRGESATFGVSGLLWRDNLVLYDVPTDSLWAQVAATAIRGPLTGETLDLVPASLTTWAAWREAHPGTRVLRPPPESGTVVGTGPAGIRDYTYNPYVGYASTDRVGLSDRTVADDRVHPKTQVLGVTHGGAARAYPLPAVAEAGVVTDRVGGLPVVVTVAPGGTLVAYERRVASRAPEATPAGPAHLRMAGSRWTRATGRAVDGPHEGDRLSPAAARSQLFWFAWRDAHPDTTVYGVDG